jgi:hypothetical protein
MTVPVWPTELPRPLRAGYQLTAGETRLRSRPDAGPVRNRRRFSGRSDALAMTLIVSRGQLARFDRFFGEELKNGALPFVMPDFETDGVGIEDGAGASLTDEAGQPLAIAADRLCQFGEGLPQRIPAGVEWRLSFALDILP